MKVNVRFYSYFKELTGVEETTELLPANATVGDLRKKLEERFPKLASMSRSTLVAVGVEYAAADQVLKPEDQVSLFPPVQGG